MTLVAVVLVSLTTVPSAHATIIANASAQLESLIITAPCDCISFSPEARSEAVAQNNLGGFVVNRDAGLTAASAATVPWADANAIADALTLKGSAVAGVHIPFRVGNGFAASDSKATLFDSRFSIQGTRPVTVHFSVIVPDQQSILTGSDSQTRAFSNTGFNLILVQPSATAPIQTILLADQAPHTVGADSSFATSGTFNLDTSHTFMPGVEYSLTANVIAVTQGTVGNPSVPEPATLTLLLAGVLLSVQIR